MNKIALMLLAYADLSAAEGLDALDDVAEKMETWDELRPDVEQAESEPEKSK